ncbi:conserved Plasmodium protein, unknown function [Plasmodium malariae]|uniref:Uncharacterized protein n=1 Tax=Plasmodium malariae TaxID=5858 RepID=A0A1D3SN44_PLAMA|nr:conserved Plasmodium protein, unknown function [Plasmodium malariae]SCO93297.1 conserved Plasmodium protein, unknown function [Plasmodium malariae]
MKNAYCFLYFCNLFVRKDDKRKTFYNLKIKKINNVEKNTLNSTDDNYSYFDKSRNNEYENILNEIIYEYEQEEKKKKGHIAGEGEEERDRKRDEQRDEQRDVLGHKQRFDQRDGGSSYEIGENEKGGKTNWNSEEGNIASNSTTNGSSKHDEIKRIENYKENGLLNLCNLNYDILNLLLKKELKEMHSKYEKYEEDGNYNKVSLFLETQAHSKIKEKDNMYIDDSVGRYFLNIDKNFIESISEREFHVLQNDIYKNIIYLKYNLLKSYKNIIHNLKQVKQCKTEQINKHVSVVYEEDNNNNEYMNDNENDNSSSNYYNENEEIEKKNAINNDRINKMNNFSNSVHANNLDKDNVSVSNQEQNDVNKQNLEQIDEQLSLDSIKEIIDVNQRLSKLQKNYNDLKNFNISQVLNKNNFLKSLKIYNFKFHHYSSYLLSKSMKKFLKKIQQSAHVPSEGTQANNEVEMSSSDIKKGIHNDIHNNKDEGKYQENVNNHSDENKSVKKKRNDVCEKENSKEQKENILTNAENNFSYICIPKVNDSNFLMKQNKSIIINLTSMNDKENNNLQPIDELNVDTDKGILILSANEKSININVRNICDKISYLTQSLSIYPQLDYKENILENIKIIKRLLMLMVFYFNIKNIYVICLDNTSTKFFYTFLNNHDDNLFKNFVNKQKQEEYFFITLNDIKFSHIINNNFIPLYSTKNIFKNYAFIMNKEENFYDISFFKRSCLFMFLYEHNDKQNHVISSSAQHFFYYKKFDYPFIYNIDNKYSIKTLKQFNEILLYLTSWIDIFHAGENEHNTSKDDKHMQDVDIPDQEGDAEERGKEDEDEFIQNMYTDEDEDEYDDYANDKDERTCEGKYGEGISNNETDGSNYKDDEQDGKNI